MPNKKLAERLNYELDELGVPALMAERVQVCAKLFKLPPFQIEALLNGIVAFSNNAMQKVADELNVSKDWLLGDSKKSVQH
ncbi:hypothetical protein [Legionella fallonii]|uniref:HTH cro/C1-type domain-containing protein n=1 Tax=Legionella fallonii LLAP-10 TaxID=1212491 RepID=A0A098GA69_9GAMM|nr:hypothetical protein [Legionella fallonii]CEG58882.1 conserved protein of unknown function [Legionella fallonii LLAP-10]